MNISYDYYKAFYNVAKYGSISKAAKSMLNNQPNLTRTIKILESQLGCPLFVRTHKGMKLTDEGKKLYEHIRIAAEHIEAAEKEITKNTNMESGTVFIAASEVALRCFLLPVLKKYRDMYPGIHIKISNHTTPQAIHELKEGSADFAVVTTPIDTLAFLTEVHVKTIREVAVCSPKYTPLTNGKVSVSELKNYPLISLGNNTKSYEFYLDFFNSHGEPFNPDIEAFTSDQILPIVKAGLGIGFVPEEFVHPYDNVKIIDLEEKIPERSICLVKRKEQPLSLAAKELEKMILSFV